MKSIEDIRAQHEKELAAHALKLSRAETLAALGLPVPDYIADGRTHGAVHVAYWNQNPKATARGMSEAVALFAQYAQAGTVIPFHVLKDDAFTTCHPEAHMPPKKGGKNPYRRDSGRHSSAYAARLGVRFDAERGHTSADLEFFAIVGGVLFSVSVDFGRGYIGACHKLAPVAKVTRGYGDRITARTFQPNTAAYSMADGFLSYSYGGDSGPIHTGADHLYLFVSDTDENGPVECSHAVAQLENLAAEVDA